MKHFNLQLPQAEKIISASQWAIPISFCPKLSILDVACVSGGFCNTHTAVPCARQRSTPCTFSSGKFLFSSQTPAAVGMPAADNVPAKAHGSGSTHQVQRGLPSPSSWFQVPSWWWRTGAELRRPAEGERHTWPAVSAVGRRRRPAGGPTGLPWCCHLRKAVQNNTITLCCITYSRAWKCTEIETWH